MRIPCLTRKLIRANRDRLLSQTDQPAKFMKTSGSSVHPLEFAGGKERISHECPPEGGFKSLCAGAPLDQHRALQEKSIALLRKLEWEGPAMVEYR